jgi:ABC-type nitrate/sulfonate/bicarbonate transport system substrate-binding protein
MNTVINHGTASRRTFNRTLVGCAGALAGFAGFPVRSIAADVLTFQANWLNDPEFIGYMIAIDKGYYAAEDLSVTYLPGGPNLIPEGSLLARKADIALTSMLTTGKAIAEKGAALKIIGAQYQKSPIGVISLAEKGINAPKDLVGKSIAAPTLSVDQLRAMIAVNKLPADKIKIVPYTFDPSPLIRGEVDAVFDFVTQLPFLVEQASGKKTHSFLAYDYGIPFAIDLVTVSDETLKTKRSQLVKFLRASLKGWNENFEDPKKYPAIMHETWFKGLGSTLQAEDYFNSVQRALMNPAGIYRLAPDDISRNLEALAALGVQGKRDMFDMTVLAEI